jgi:hypothetical protein
MVKKKGKKAVKATKKIEPVYQKVEEPEMSSDSDMDQDFVGFGAKVKRPADGDTSSDEEVLNLGAGIEEVRYTIHYKY